MKLYELINAKDELPPKKGHYYTDKGSLFYDNGIWTSYAYSISVKRDDVKEWFREVS